MRSYDSSNLGCHRGQIDDTAPLASPHRGQNRLCHQKTRLEICGNQVIPILFTDLLDRLRAGDARVVHEDIDGPEPLPGALDQLRDFTRAGNVSLNAEASPFQLADLGFHRGCFVRAGQEVEDNVGSRLGKSQRDGTANPPAGTGNQGNFSYEVIHGLRIYPFGPPPHARTVSELRAVGPVGDCGIQGGLSRSRWRHRLFRLECAKLSQEIDKNSRSTNRGMSREEAPNAIFRAPPMKILITGSSGLIGSALISFLKAQGHQVVSLVRRKVDAEEGLASWDPKAGKLSPSVFEDVHAVVNLAGESIAAGRWTPERKRRILESRVQGTKLLSETLAQLANPPEALVSASAVGYYGSRGEEVLSEEEPPGSGFLPDVCLAWEGATEPARQRGVRVVKPRIGMVLSGKGGALPRMASAFKMGVGGRLGDGRQFMAWIAIDDLTRMILHLIIDNSHSGPVNAVAPQPVRNQEFTAILGKVLWRPTFFTMPAFVTRLVFGEMADALLLSSTRAEPARLQAGGFKFLYPELEGALRHVLGKS